MFVESSHGDEVSGEMGRMGKKIGMEIQNELLKIDRANHRRLMMEESDLMKIVGIRKCIFYDAASEVCVEYNYFVEVVLIDVITMEDSEHIAHDAGESIHFAVEQHVIEKDECVKLMMMKCSICLSKDNVFYIEDSDRYMNLLEQLDWNEIIEFQETNRIHKCVNLQAAKLCVAHDGNESSVIELRWKLID